MHELQVWVAVGFVIVALQLFALVSGATATAEVCVPITRPALYVTEDMRDSLLLS